MLRRLVSRPGPTRMAVGGLLLAALGAAPVHAFGASPGGPTCTSPGPGRPLFITETCQDPRFNDGYAFVSSYDVHQAPVPYTVVTGGFRGTDARFAFYFPPASQYQGRFYEGPVHQLRPSGEVALPSEALNAFDAGSYLVETNNGGAENCLAAREEVQHRCDPSVRGYRVFAAAARFSRVVAQQVYGTTARPYGYLYGGSGGAYQTLAAAENSRGVWDGFLPFVMGDPFALLAHFTESLHAARVVGPKLANVIEAMEPGGSGDPYRVLDAQQKAALREATRFGFPLRAWTGRTTDGGPNFLTGDYIKLYDPTYERDFFTKPGYLGTARSPEGRALRAAHYSEVVDVVAVAPANPAAPLPQYPEPPPYPLMGPAYPYFMVATIAQTLPPKVFVVDRLPSGDLTGAMIDVVTGPGRGKHCPLSVVNAEQRLVQCAGGSDPQTVVAIEAGDKIRISNSFALSYETQPRHDLPPAAWHVATYDQFRTASGAARYPQRPVSPALLSGPDAGGALATGRFFGKMIVMNCLMDQDAYPYPAAWYRQRATQYGRAADLRVWFSDNCVHTAAEGAQTVNYGGILQQGLRDLAAWAEHGKPPAVEQYTVDADNQVHVPATAAARGGIQPVVAVTANGRQGRVDITAGDIVTLKGVISAPPGTGKVVCAQWDPDGSGRFATAAKIASMVPATAFNADPSGGALFGAPVPAPPDPSCEAAGTSQTITLAHTYSTPGTYFAGLLGTTQRTGDARTPYARCENIGRVRIVVH